MPDTAELIERLERCDGHDTELCAEIHRAVTPSLADTLVRGRWLVGGNHPQPTAAPDYLGSIDAALTLVPEGWTINLLFAGGWSPECQLWEHHPGERDVKAEGTTPALALCIAALKARSAA